MIDLDDAQRVGLRTCMDLRCTNICLLKKTGGFVMVAFITV